MAQIRHGGKTYDMTMHNFLLYKKAQEMVDELMRKPDLLEEFNKQMRIAKLKNIKNGINGR